jgi:hypothetical protein
MLRVAAKFVTRILTADQQQQCVNVLVELHQITSDNATWIYGYDRGKETILPMEKSKLIETEKGIIGEEQSQEHAQEFILAGSQFCILLLTFYGECEKMCKHFIPNFGDRRTGCCIMTTHHITLPFSPEISYQKQLHCHHQPTLLFSVSLIEDQTERMPY